jgi:hypothetical protein
MPGLQRRHHAQALRHAQDLWDLGCTQDAVAVLEAVQPRLHPKTVATDAMIVATLATYVSELGDAHRGVALLSQIPLDGTRLTEVHLICLGARCQCRAAAGDLEGALHDRATIYGCDPKHPALALADTALAGPGLTWAAERPA